MSCCPYASVKTIVKLYRISTTCFPPLFCSVKTSSLLCEGNRSHTLNLSISSDVLSASNQRLCMAVLVECSRPGGIPGISQKSFPQPEPKKHLLQQVWQSAAYVRKTIQWQIPSDTEQRKHKASTQLEASGHREGGVSQALWAFLLEDSKLCGGWWAHTAFCWDVAAAVSMLSRLGYPVELLRLRDGYSHCLL